MFIVKCFNFSSFVERLNPCLLPIIAHTVLKGDVEQMRREQYSLENTEHERLLTKVDGQMDGQKVDKCVTFLSFIVVVSLTS